MTDEPLDLELLKHSIAVAVSQCVFEKFSFGSPRVGATIVLPIHKATEPGPIGEWILQLHEDGRLWTVSAPEEYLELPNGDTDMPPGAWAVRVGDQLLRLMAANRTP